MKKAIIIGTISIAALLISVFFIAWLTKSDLEKYIIMQNEWYAGKWDFDHINIDSENKAILIRFDKKSGEWNYNIENIHEIYEWLYKKIYESDNLREYSVSIDFVSIGEYFSIRNLTYNFNQLEIRCNTAVSLEKIAAKFSEATELYLFPAYYDDITEIGGFCDLQYVYFSNTITDDEIATIKSCFPNCELECNISA